MARTFNKNMKTNSKFMIDSGTTAHITPYADMVQNTTSVTFQLLSGTTQLFVQLYRATVALNGKVKMEK